MSEEVLVKQEAKAELICNCGADVRADAQYCYNCGGKILTSTDTSVDKSAGVRTFEAAANGSARPKSRSRRIRPETKTVEVMWRRSEGPGYFLLFIALGIAVIVGVFLGIAIYLR